MTSQDLISFYGIGMIATFIMIIDGLWLQGLGKAIPFKWNLILLSGATLLWPVFLLFVFVRRINTTT